MSNAQLQRHIRLLAKSSGNVWFTQHALDRMQSRQVSDLEVLECLRHGLIQRPPVIDRVSGDLKCRMEHFGTARNLAVIVALRAQAPDALVVTVMTRTR